MAEGTSALMNGRGGPKVPGFGTRAEVGDYYFLTARQEVKPNESGETGWKRGDAEAEATTGGMQPSTEGRGRMEKVRGKTALRMWLHFPETG